MAYIYVGNVIFKKYASFLVKYNQYIYTNIYNGAYRFTFIIKP